MFRRWIRFDSLTERKHHDEAYEQDGNDADDEGDRPLENIDDAEQYHEHEEYRDAPEHELQPLHAPLCAQ